MRAYYAFYFPKNGANYTPEWITICLSVNSGCMVGRQNPSPTVHQPFTAPPLRLPSPGAHFFCMIFRYKWRVPKYSRPKPRAGPAQVKVAVGAQLVYSWPAQPFTRKILPHSPITPSVKGLQEKSPDKKRIHARARERCKTVGWRRGDRPVSVGNGVPGAKNLGAVSAFYLPKSIILTDLRFFTPPICAKFARGVS